MTDIELSECAKNLMAQNDYDGAISYLRRMKNNLISMEMELLVIEHEQGYLQKRHCND